VTLQFEYAKTIPGTCIKAEIHEMGRGWWRYFLTNEETGEMSGVHEFHLRTLTVNHEGAAEVAFAIWLSHKLET